MSRAKQPRPKKAPRPLDTPDDEVIAVANAMLKIPNLIELCSDSLLRSIIIILQDKEMHEVCSNVKAAIGSVLEQYLLPNLELPKNKRGIDTEIVGVPVDIKHSVKTGWMVGEECFGHVCLLFQTNYSQQQFSVAVVRAKMEYLGRGSNKDSKKSFLKWGRDNFTWLIRDEPFRELLQLPSIKEIADLKSQVAYLAEENADLKKTNADLNMKIALLRAQMTPLSHLINTE